MQSDGLVVTNAHVIADALDRRAPAATPTRNSRPVIVSLPDGRSFEGTIAALDRWGGILGSQLSAINAYDRRVKPCKDPCQSPVIDCDFDSQGGAQPASGCMARCLLR